MLGLNNNSLTNATTDYREGYFSRPLGRHGFSLRTVEHREAGWGAGRALSKTFMWPISMGSDALGRQDVHSQTCAKFAYFHWPTASRQPSAVVPVGVCVRVPCSVDPPARPLCVLGVMLTRAELELCLCTRWFFNNNSLIDTAPVYREVRCTLNHTVRLRNRIKRCG